MQKFGMEIRFHFFEIEIKSFKNFQEMYTMIRIVKGDRTLLSEPS